MNISQLLRASAGAYPHEPAIIQDDEVISYREFDERTDKLATFLLEKGIKSGDRVAYLFWNQWEVLVAYHAITRVGALGVSINHRLTSAEKLYQLEQSSSRMLLFDASFEDTVTEVAAASTTIGDYVVANGSAEVATASMAEIMKRRPQDPGSAEWQVGPDTDAGIWFTSGTTGQPKGAITRHSSAVWSAVAVAITFGMNHRTRLLSVAPMFHRGAMEDFHLAVTLAGGTHYLTPRFSPEDVLERIQRDKITHAFIVPTMARMMAGTANAGRFDVSSLQCWISASAPLTTDLAAEIRRVFNLRPAVLMNCYGITESLLNTVCTGDDFIARPTSVGRVVPGMQVSVIRIDGSFASDNETGELVTCGPTCLRTYLNNEQAYRAATFEAGGVRWYRTGDLGYRDAEGYIYIVDRSKDMIISGGENVYCIEVESAISAHPKVLEVAVLGREDSKWGERVIAVIVQKDGAHLGDGEILAQCQALARYKWPREIHFMDQLPRNSFGKIQKKTLRDMVMQLVPEPPTMQA